LIVEHVVSHLIECVPATARTNKKTRCQQENERGQEVIFSITIRTITV